MKLKPFNLRSFFFFFTKQFQTQSISSFSIQKCSTFCTTNQPRRKSNYFNDVVPGTSAVYNHALKFQRPLTIKWKPHLVNTVSFIGYVAREIKRVNSKTGNFGVYTTLHVRSSNQPNSSSLWVFLMIWDNVAEIAYEHLKPNQLICVSGSLESYNRDDDGELCYKLIVKELDFVAQKLDIVDQEKEKNLEGGDQSAGNQQKLIAKVGNQSDGNQQNSIAKGGNQSGGNRLHLWQVFFANPNEWWDQRKRKLNPKQPDFKHKDTGEALWLSKNDPPWVRRQIELIDSNIAEGGFAGRRSRVASWVYDE